MNVLMVPGQMGSGDGSALMPYESGCCAQCGRPMVRLPAEYPPAEVRFIRRHLAWWHLGKMYEHAGNTLVLRG
jgi:hypothetical protein